MLGPVLKPPQTLENPTNLSIKQVLRFGATSWLIISRYMFPWIWCSRKNGPLILPCQPSPHKKSILVCSSILAKTLCTSPITIVVKSSQQTVWRTAFSYSKRACNEAVLADQDGWFSWTKRKTARHHCVPVECSKSRCLSPLPCSRHNTQYAFFQTSPGLCSGLHHAPDIFEHLLKWSTWWRLNI